MPKYIKKKDLKNAIDECTWYHIGKNGELVEGANSSEHEPLYKYSDIKEIIKNLPTRKFETEPKHTALSKALKWTYGDEPNKKIKADRKTEPQTMLNDGTLVINVEDATKVSRVLVGDDKNRGDLYYPDDEDEPQTERPWGMYIVEHPMYE